MSDWIAILLAVYIYGYVVEWRKTVYDVAWGEATFRDHPDRLLGRDVCTALLVGTLFGFFWPLFLLADAIRRVDPETFVRRFGSEPKSARLEREATERSRRIEKLERELDIR